MAPCFRRGFSPRKADLLEVVGPSKHEEWHGWRIKRPELVSVFASNWGAKRGGTRAGHLAQRTRTLIFQPYH